MRYLLLANGLFAVAICASANASSPPSGSASSAAFSAGPASPSGAPVDTSVSGQEGADPAPPPAAVAAPAVGPTPAIVASAPMAPAAVAEERAARASDDNASARFWQIYAGAKTSWVSSSGFDPYSTTNDFTYLSAGASRSFGDALWAFAPGLTFERASTEAPAHGAQASLEVNRFGLSLEARHSFASFAYAFARLAPNLSRIDGALREDSSLSPMKSGAWRGGVDLSVGGAMMLARLLRDSTGKGPRVWLLVEGGYGWVKGAELSYRPSLPDDDQRPVSAIQLGSVSLAGPVAKAFVALTY